MTALFCCFFCLAVLHQSSLTFFFPSSFSSVLHLSSSSLTSSSFHPLYCLHPSLSTILTRSSPSTVFCHLSGLDYCTLFSDRRYFAVHLSSHIDRHAHQERVPFFFFTPFFTLSFFLHFRYYLCCIALDQTPTHTHTYSNTLPPPPELHAE